MPNASLESSECIAVYTLTFKTENPTSFTLHEDNDSEPRYTLLKPSVDIISLLDTLPNVEIAAARRLKPNKLWLLTLQVSFLLLSGLC
jgi:hypothetical protein